jgi:hypothetical protein
MKSTISLNDISSSLIFSSLNANNIDLTNKSNNVFKTGSYLIVSINKPEFALKLATNGLNCTDLIENSQGPSL